MHPCAALRPACSLPFCCTQCLAQTLRRLIERFLVPRVSNQTACDLTKGESTVACYSDPCAITTVACGYGTGAGAPLAPVPPHGCACHGPPAPVPCSPPPSPSPWPLLPAHGWKTTSCVCSLASPCPWLLSQTLGSWRMTSQRPVTRPLRPVAGFWARSSWPR